MPKTNTLRAQSIQTNLSSEFQSDGDASGAGCVDGWAGGIVFMTSQYLIDEDLNR